MAKVNELIGDAAIEIRLPILFSKMKVSIEGRLVSVGRKKGKKIFANFEYGGNSFSIILTQRNLPSGFDLEILKNDIAVLSKSISLNGKELDSRLINMPKWMYTFPIAASIPVFIGGAIPAMIGALGAGSGYKIIASFRENKLKLIFYSLINISLTYCILAISIFGFQKGLFNFGMMKHNEQLLKSIVQDANKNLPKKLDNITSLVKATYEKDTLIFHYDLEPFDAKAFDKINFDKILGTQIIKSACSDPNMKKLLKNSYWIKYDYNANNVNVDEIYVSLSNCNQL